MATINWPTAIKPGAVDYGIEFDVQLQVMRNGRVITYGLPGARWVATINFEAQREQQVRPALEALIVSLEGGANRLSMPHWGRPRPNGTLTGSPTLQSSVPAGAKSIAISNANGTLRSGDIIGLPGQMVMVVADVTPSGGVLSGVQVRPAIRAAHASGTAVTWNAPTTLWIPRTSVAGPFPYMPAKHRPGFAVEFVEAFA